MTASSRRSLVLAALVAWAACAVGVNAATLKVTSFPSGAEVIVDGVSRGFTPAFIGGIEEGVHAVTVQIPGSIDWAPATTDFTVTSGNNDLSVTLLPEADITAVNAGEGLLGGGEEGEVTLSLDPDTLADIETVVNNTFLVVDEAPSGAEAVNFIGTIAVVSEVPGEAGLAGATASGGTGVLGRVLNGMAPAVLPRGTDDALSPEFVSYDPETGLNVMPVQGGSGIAGEFLNETGGQILSGQTTGMVEVFAVQGDGTIETAGDIRMSGYLFAHDNGGTYNTAVGRQALENATSLTSGSTAVGYGALSSDTGSPTYGSRNTAVGSWALRYNTTGYTNVAVGNSALRGNTTAGENTAIGHSALSNNYGATATRNTAIGTYAMSSNTDGTHNTATGAFALRNNTTGNHNTAVGTSTLRSNTSGEFNIAIGGEALYSNDTGRDNTVLGFGAMSSNTDGSSNVALGAGALINNIDSNNNVAIGTYAGSDLTSGYGNNILIDNPGAATENYTIRIGNNHQQTFIAGIKDTDIAGGSVVVIDGYGQLGTMAGGYGTLNNVALGDNTIGAGTTGANNVALGANTLYSNTTGNSNIAVGAGALGYNIDGSYNLAVGSSALNQNTSGYSNTAVGDAALGSNSTGYYNIAVGRGALFDVTSGSGNVALAGGGGLISGSYNVFIATGAGGANESNTMRIGDKYTHNQTFIAGIYGVNVAGGTPVVIDSNGQLGTGGGGGIYVGGYEFVHENGGGYNTAVGRQALANATTSSNNAALGYQALYYNTTGSENTAVGGEALRSNNGYGNTALGQKALFSSTSGNNNIAVGLQALYRNQIGSSNTALGTRALSYSVDNNDNVAIGDGALENLAGSNSHGNLAIGSGAGVNMDNGGNNVFIANEGPFSDDNSIRIGNPAHTKTFVTGIYGVDIPGGTPVVINSYGQLGITPGGPPPGLNTGFGYNALATNSTGTNNTAVGAYALFLNSTGYENTAVGMNALYYNSTGYSNSAFGHQALVHNEYGWGNTAIGRETMNQNTSGYANTAVGSTALVSNTTGARNTVSGHFAMFNNITGHRNTASGYSALISNTAGSENVAFGMHALAASTGNNNIGLGYAAGQLNQVGDNNIFIGHRGDTYDANTIRIGDGANHSYTFIAGIDGVSVGGSAVEIDGNGQLGTTVSSRRYKEEIEEMAEASEGLLELRPVTFRYKKEFVGNARRELEFGLIAEEVADIFPNLVVYDQEGRPKTVRYRLLSSLLLNELQKQQEQLAQVGRQLTHLEQRLRADRKEEPAARLHPPLERSGAK